MSSFVDIINKINEAHRDILDKLNKAYEHRDEAAENGSEDYYYWNGYIAALDYVTDGYQLLQEEVD